MTHQHEHEAEHEHDHEHLHDRHFGGRGGAMRGPRGGRWGGERGGWGGGRRMRRGDIRRPSSLPSTIARSRLRGHAPAGGDERGPVRPSPGSVYPHLQMLEDEGLVRSAELDGTRTFTLTEKGAAEAAKAPLPWQSGGETDDQIRTLRLGIVS